jgi:hypothetical protein
LRPHIGKIDGAAGFVTLLAGIGLPDQFDGAIRIPAVLASEFSRHIADLMMRLEDRAINRRSTDTGTVES